METTAEHYKKMTPEQRIFNKEYLEKSLNAPDGSVGQMKWMWPYWKESLQILISVMTELGELSTATNNQQPVTSNM